MHFQVSHLRWIGTVFVNPNGDDCFFNWIEVVSPSLNEKKLLDSNLKFRSMFLPDRFIDHDKPDLMYKYAGLDATNIENKILDTINSKVVIKKSN